MKSDDHFSGTSNAALAPGGTTDTSFTGMKPDTVSTAYDFLMREYSTEGRWPSPDPAGLAAVNPANPQSWNRYAYVHNNPLNYVDPYGLCSASFDYTYDLWGYVINGVFYMVGGWIEIHNLELYDCGPQQRLGLGAGPGGGQGGGQGPKPTQQPRLSPAAQACAAQAQAEVQQELHTFAGYAGIRLFGRVVFTAGIGAFSVAYWTKYGGALGFAVGAAIGGAMAGVKTAWQDSNTIQKIQNSFMGKLQACLQKSLTPQALPQ